MAGLFVPQLVSPVDTKGLANIGESIGRWRENSAIAEIMQGIDPYDPNSGARVIQKLQTYGGPVAREMADRLQGIGIQQKQFEQTHGLAKERVGVERDKFSLEQQKFGLEQANQRALEEGLTKYGRGGAGGATPAAAAPSAPATRPAAPAEDEDDDWKDATPEEGGKAKPRVPTSGPTSLFQTPPRAAAPVVGGFATAPASGVRAADGLLATGAAPMAGPLPAPPPAPVGGTAGTGAAPVPPVAPQGLVSVAAGPLAAAATRRAIPAVVTATTPTATPVPAAAAAAAEPVEEAGDVPAAEDLPAPGTPQPRATVDYTPRQLELRQANRNLGGLMRYAKTPAQQRAVQTHIDENNAEYAEIEAERTRGDAERKAAQKVVTAQAAKDRSKLLMDMGKRTQDNINLRDNLMGLKRVANSPSSALGTGGWLRANVGALGLEVNKALKDLTGVGLDERLGPDAYNKWVQDPVARRRTAESLINALTLKLTGGSFGTNISNADRETIARINASLSDDPETIKRIVNMHLAILEREDRMFKIAVQGEKKGKTAAQIQARLSRYGKENPLFQHEDGEPTKLGREIDPSGARDYDAAQKAARERAAKAGEEFRDTSGAGEAAVIGGRPTPAQIRATREFDAAVREVPGRPVTGAGSSREPGFGPAGLERAQADVERLREALGGVPEAPEVRPGIEAAQRGERQAPQGTGLRDLMQWTGPMGYGDPGTGRTVMPRGGQAPMAVPQRLVGEDLDYGGLGGERKPFDIESVAGPWNQAARLAPNGIPIEAMRRSTNVEDRTGGTIEPETLETALARNPNLRNQEAFRAWIRENDRNRYYEGLTPSASPELSQEAGLADLNAPGYMADLRRRNLERDRRAVGDRAAQMGSDLFSGQPMLPLPLPPGRQSKATEEAERRRRNRRTPK